MIFLRHILVTKSQLICQKFIVIIQEYSISLPMEISELRMSKINELGSRAVCDSE